MSDNGVVGGVANRVGARGAKGGAKAPTARVRQQAKAACRAERWAHVYTGLAISASAGLNGYAAWSAPGIPSPVAGAVLGSLVPVLVWVLAKVTAWTYRAGWKRWARVPGTVACALLALSLAHVATAFAALTGTAAALSWGLAVGVDAGLVASEATAILVAGE